MNSRKAFEQAAKHQEIGPYSEYATAQEKAMKLKLQGAKSIRIDKKKGEWVISFVGENTMGNPRKAFEQALGQVRPEDRQNPRIAFEQALMQRLAIEFPTEEARKKYLEKHPKADPKKHTVKKEKESPESRDGVAPKEKTEKDAPTESKALSSEKDAKYQKSDAYRTLKGEKRRKDYNPQKAPEGITYNVRDRDLTEDLSHDVKDAMLSMPEASLPFPPKRRGMYNPQVKAWTSAARSIALKKALEIPVVKKLRDSLVESLAEVKDEEEFDKKTDELVEKIESLKTTQGRADYIWDNHSSKLTDADTDVLRFATRKTWYALQAYEDALRVAQDAFDKRKEEDKD
jgi:hypothetical protein